MKGYSLVDSLSEILYKEKNNLNTSSVMDKVRIVQDDICTMLNERGLGIERNISLNDLRMLYIKLKVDMVKTRKKYFERMKLEEQKSLIDLRILIKKLYEKDIDAGKLLRDFAKKYDLSKYEKYI